MLTTRDKPIMRFCNALIFLLVIVNVLEFKLEAGKVHGMKLSITVDNVATSVYVDGVQKSLSSYNNWAVVDTVNIPLHARVIAVQARDDGVVAGILASVNNGQWVTDTSWKCTTSYSTNWMQPTFNDASWPAAVVAGTNTDGDIHRNLPAISSTAKWIWTRNYRQRIDPVVYCRGHLQKRIAITVDNEAYKVYADGWELSLKAYNKWELVDTVNIPTTTRVIAVEGRDRGVVAGILASVNSGRWVTNRSWKCTAKYYANWMHPSFNDASWPAAVESYKNDGTDGSHGTLSAVSSRAKWIWTKNFRNPIDRVVYCRGHLRGNGN